MKPLFLTLAILLCLSGQGQDRVLPEGFIYLHQMIPGIELDIRYAGDHNFLGNPVNGYNRPVAILSKPAADALIKVQHGLMQQGYCLKVFDAYRPQMAVDHFVVWARDTNDTLAKQEFYPDVPKSELFQRGYIASKSGHSRGSTVDLTIIDAKTKKELDMGSSYDFFGIISHHDSGQVTKEQRANRELLKSLMKKQGFHPYPEEWWHYTLRNEPYPETYFDFPVE
ncbi:MAG: M15 family metallopeptidase [Salegentibacter sp.]|uniref:D-alanyl-D-alanine dipeptidase n=1 Tax=Salegentibacter flavus TaxID=287099 RepID=A0A1I4Z034_9FLAO|nr:MULTISPECIES: M15 family metallopeptidase [Salegentibacter]MDR9458167.1 M15 family metallopeptidase [Salegentibacter sp.]SFN43309.1 D-alanyl-D-alanine dipeptidase [Salegentibacter flavus]